MPNLFDPFEVRGITLPNRIGVSPMQQYMAEDGFANDWHLVHLGSRAVGGAGMVTVEATVIDPSGRWTVNDLGIWDDAFVPGLARIAHFIQAQGVVPAIQIGHAGSKASRSHPRDGFKNLPAAEGGWELVSSSAVPAMEGFPIPRALGLEEIPRVIDWWRQAARRAAQAGFQVLELHGAHGYLIHEFLSPARNLRTDAYGGSFENRMRFLEEIIAAVREVWPEENPLALRISATDFIANEPAWTLDDSVELGKRVKAMGIDWIAVSAGGFAWPKRELIGPGYQVPYASRILAEADIPTQTVGLITSPAQANEIIESGKATLVALGREMLREPYFGIKAAQDLKMDVPVPEPYKRAFD